MATPHIPIYSLNDINKSGVEIRYFADTANLNSIEKDDENIYGPHRDDHYMFFFQQEGTSELMLDFKRLKRTGSWLFFLLPGQVHQVISNEHSTGWFLALSSERIAESYRAVFEEMILVQEPITPTAEIAQQLNHTLSLLDGVCNEQSELKFQQQLMHSLIDTCMGFFASAFLASAGTAPPTDLRPIAISRAFRVLLRKNFKAIKSPSEYAALLHISTTYLNEAVKQQTGFAVSRWIQQEVMMEAKRLLFYTQGTVKEIAHVLGYPDHAYFSRLFSKVVGQSPQQFRRHYRE